MKYLHKPLFAAFPVLMVMLIGYQLAQGEFLHRYPLIKGYRHHNYFEGYELPTFGTGPLYPVATPDNKSIIFSAKGYIWRYDIQTAVATRLTMTGEADMSPCISPDGSTIAFVRDNTQSCKIILLDLATNQEKILVNSGLIDMDPAFSADGKTLYYSSSEYDAAKDTSKANTKKLADMNIWSIDIASGTKTNIIYDFANDMRPQPLPDGKKLIYINKMRDGNDRIYLYDLQTKEKTELRRGSIIAQMRPALSPDGQSLIVNWPDEGSDQEYKLWLFNLGIPGLWANLNTESVLPLTPSWSFDQQTIYFSEPDDKQNFILKKMAATGGKPQTLPVKTWNWGVPMARILIKTHFTHSSTALIAARLNVLDAQGHPMYPDISNVRFDSQNGLNYFHTPGTIELKVPAGQVSVFACHGFIAIPTKVTKEAKKDAITVIDVAMEKLPDPKAKGWYSGDLHFHLNYGGTYYMTPDHLVLGMKGEDLDVAAPMSANLNIRNMDAEWTNWKRDKAPIIHFSQEVRSHYLGHIGLINIKEWFSPWYYGPMYTHLNTIDLPNYEVCDFGKKQNGITIYVHPIYGGNPFAEGKEDITPPGLIPDAVGGKMDALELACMWADAIGTSELYYRLLNIGLPILPNGGSDVFPNYYRHMIFGSARVYANLKGKPLTWDSFIAAYRKANTYVTTGPLIDFSVNGLMPGSVLKKQVKSVTWKLDLVSATPVKTVDIIVNGDIVKTETGLDKAGKKSYSGTIDIPENGWIACRVYGGEHQWPVMHSEPFAHTSPIWIKEIGSQDPAHAKKAAGELLKIVNYRFTKIDADYLNKPIPKIKAQLEQTKLALEKKMNQ